MCLACEVRPVAVKFRRVIFAKDREGSTGVCAIDLLHNFNHRHIYVLITNEHGP